MKVLLPLSLSACFVAGLCLLPFWTGSTEAKPVPTLHKLCDCAGLGDCECGPQCGCAACTAAMMTFLDQPISLESRDESLVAWQDSPSNVLTLFDGPPSQPVPNLPADTPIFRLFDPPSATPPPADLAAPPAVPMPDLFTAPAPTKPSPTSAVAVPTPPAPSDARPVVYYWVSSNCGRCEVWKRDRPQLDRSLRFVDGRKLWPNYAVSSYPSFWWRGADGKWKGSEGYASATALLQAVNRTRVRPFERIAERQQSYRTRAKSEWWTSPAKTREDLIRHLQGGEHAGKFTLAYLQSLTWEQLNALHSDDHERRVQWPLVSR